MNPQVRTYLIELARNKRNKIVTYSDLARDCNLGLNLSLPKDRIKLSEILGAVSKFEHEHGRPLVSALVIYSLTNDHGGGFYALAESLGIGNARALEKADFGITEAAESKRFWSDENNYRNFAALRDEEIGTDKVFTLESLEFFSAWQGKSYLKDNAEHEAAGKNIRDSLWEPTLQLGNAIIRKCPNFDTDGGKYFLQLGGGNPRIKPYTWVKLFKSADKDKGVFFTFGINAIERAFVYKIDCLDKDKSSLSKEQIQGFRSLLTDATRWNSIPYEKLIDYNFSSLAQVCEDFVTTYESEYDALVQTLWGEAIVSNIFRDAMVQRARPKGREALPESDRKFRGTDTDFLAKNKDQKDLGDRGEKLVVLHEVKILTALGRIEEAAQVRRAKDGEGYDVLSFDEAGSEKYIEVKTTTSGADQPFHLSENEVAFMAMHPGQYALYRLYGYDAKRNVTNFFEIRGNATEQLLMQPTQYKVYLRSP